MPLLPVHDFNFVLLVAVALTVDRVTGLPLVCMRNEMGEYLFGPVAIHYTYALRRRQHAIRSSQLSNPTVRVHVCVRTKDFDVTCSI